MYRNIFVVVSILIFLSTASSKSFSKDKGLTIAIESFGVFTFWENDYKKEKFDALGLGFRITPKLQFKRLIGNAYFQLEIPISYSRFNGPDGLTITGPDIDIDTNFNSTMLKKDFSLRVGHNLLKYFNLSFIVRYNHLKLDGKHEVVDLNYKYIEKGFLLGPSLSTKLILQKTVLFFDISYLIGNLSTDYHPASYGRARILENAIKEKLFMGEFGLLIPISSSMDLTLKYKSELYFKSPGASQDELLYNPTDVWFQGIATSFAYHF